jgi:hypothetical protein
VRQTERAEEVQAVLDLDIALGATCQVHLYDFEAASKPTLSSPDAVDRQQVKPRLKADALEGIGALKFAERRAAKKAAQERLDAEVERPSDLAYRYTQAILGGVAAPSRR